MRYVLILVTMVFSLSLLPPLYSNVAHAKDTLPRESFADLVEHLLPAVVNISSTQKVIEPEDFPDMPHFPPGSPFEDFFEEFMDRRGRGMPMLPPSSLGSGFIIDAKKGLIVTNNHVVLDADEVRVTLHNDTTIEAEVIGRDEKTDLALLKVETDIKLTEVKFGDSESLRVGDWIVAIGNPYGLGGTVTAGIISAQQRDINAGPYDDFIQTDASINKGNSGGPMFNLDGKVVGINTAIFSPSGGSVGIGFAIPADLAKPVINQLIEYGRTRRGWLGVRIQGVTEEIAESLGLEKARGALVASVTQSGPAEKAGLEPGDIILEFDGKKITEMRTLPRIVAETKIGSEASVKYWRSGQERVTKVSIGELEKAEEQGLVDTGVEQKPSQEESLMVTSLGLGLRNISDSDRTNYKIPKDIQGVIISKVEPNSAAAEKQLMPGDVIVEINQQQLKSPSQAKDIIEKAEKAGRSSILLLLNRSGDTHFEALKLQKK